MVVCRKKRFLNNLLLTLFIIASETRVKQFFSIYILVRVRDYVYYNIIYLSTNMATYIPMRIS